MFKHFTSDKDGLPIAKIGDSIKPHHYYGTLFGY